MHFKYPQQFSGTWKIHRQPTPVTTESSGETICQDDGEIRSATLSCLRALEFLRKGRSAGEPLSLGANPGCCGEAVAEKSDAQRQRENRFFFLVEHEDFKVCPRQRAR